MRLIKYQGQGTGQFNEVIIGKGLHGWYVLMSNPNNAVHKYFKTKNKATVFAKKWMEINRRINFIRVF